MSNHARLRAAVQMKADGISRMAPRDHRNGPCDATVAEADGIAFRCGKHGRHMTPDGVRCFTHARRQPA